MYHSHPCPAAKVILSMCPLHAKPIQPGDKHEYAPDNEGWYYGADLAGIVKIKGQQGYVQWTLAEISLQDSPLWMSLTLAQKSREVHGTFEVH